MSSIIAGLLILTSSSARSHVLCSIHTPTSKEAARNNQRLIVAQPANLLVSASFLVHQTED